MKVTTRWAWIGAMAGFMAAQACDREGTGDLRIRATCNDYCDKAKECDDNVDEDDCQSRCESDMEDCQSDEQEEALDDLDDCAQDSCNEFLGCTIGAGLQCTFGL